MPCFLFFLKIIAYYNTIIEYHFLYNGIIRIHFSAHFHNSRLASWGWNFKVKILNSHSLIIRLLLQWGWHFIMNSKVKWNILITLKPMRTLQSCHYALFYFLCIGCWLIILGKIVFATGCRKYIKTHKGSIYDTRSPQTTTPDIQLKVAKYLQD